MTDIQRILDITIEDHYDPSDEEILQTYAPNMFCDDKAHSINENTFARAFTDINKLNYNNGIFYTRYGKVTEEIIAQDIWRSLESLGISKNVAQTTNKLLGAVKLASTVPKLQMPESVIPLANGDIDIKTRTFHRSRYISTPYRLPVSLSEEYHTPNNFLKWEHDLLYDEDIPVIEQYLGYCLIPSTKAQKALFLVGEGGMGKSVFGKILECLLGESITSVQNSQVFLQGQFSLAELENSLVLYDDDLDNAALSNTGLYKKLITNTLKITADRKYAQPFKFTPQVKLVACCNEMLTSMYDTTSGFFRRLLPLSTKTKSDDFVPDTRFYDKISDEIPNILYIALRGLFDLIDNDYILPESHRTEKYMKNKKENDNHLPSFFEECFVPDEFEKFTIKDMLDAYESWCDINAFMPFKSRTVLAWFSNNAEKLGLKKARFYDKDGNRTRGYMGASL